jgi:hypothetical protein
VYEAIQGYSITRPAMFVTRANDILKCEHQGNNFIEEITYTVKVTFHLIREPN